MKKLIIILVGVAVAGFMVIAAVASVPVAEEDWTSSLREKINNYVKENVLPVVSTERATLNLGSDEDKIDELRSQLRTLREEMTEIRKKHRESMQMGDGEMPRPDEEEMQRMHQLRFEHQKLMHEVFAIVLRHEAEIMEDLEGLKKYADQWRDDIHTMILETRNENGSPGANKMPGGGFQGAGKKAQGGRLSGPGLGGQGPGPGFGGRGPGGHWAHMLNPIGYVLLDPENMDEWLGMGASFQGRVFPNPTSGMLNIEFDVAEFAPVQVALFDSQGNKLDVVIERSYQPGIYVVPFSTGDLTPGVYFYEVAVGDQVSRNRFVKR